MESHNIDAMADAVAQALGHGTQSHGRRKIRTALAAYWADKVAIVWSVEDVQAECPGLAAGEAAEVLRKVFRGHDSTLGISWDTIRQAGIALHGDRAAGPTPEE